MSGEGDEQVRETLDQIFRGDEQTYEQFINGFLFLRREDVTGPSEVEINNLEHADSVQVNGNGHTLSRNGLNGFESYENSSPKDGNDLQPSGEESSFSQSSDHSLSEEDLGPGNHAPSILMRTSETTGGTIVQLDNFVDDEGSPLSDLSPEDSEDDADCSYIFSGHTNTSLSQTGTQLHPSQTRADVSHSAVQERLPLQKSTSPSDDYFQSEKMDKENANNINNLSEPEPYPCGYGLNIVKPLPGEVDSAEFEDESSSPNATNVRHLSIKTTFRQCPDDDDSGNSTQPQNETEYCEVEPFSIDEEFDYDNVVLTPKFNFMSSIIKEEDK